MNDSNKKLIKQELAKKVFYINQRLWWMIALSILRLLLGICAIVFIALFVVQNNVYFHDLHVLKTLTSHSAQYVAVENSLVDAQFSSITYRDLMIVFIVLFFLIECVLTYFYVQQIIAIHKFEDYVRSLNLFAVYFKATKAIKNAANLSCLFFFIVDILLLVKTSKNFNAFFEQTLVALN